MHVVSNEDTDDLVTEYLNARAERDKAQAKLDQASAQLIDRMESEHRKSFRWTKDGFSKSVTFVRKHTTEIDEKGLRKALRAKTFDKYTKRVLDRKAMEAAMDSGEVDPVTVSRFVTLRPHKPYLEYREKEVPE